MKRMEEIRSNWKKWFSWFLLIVSGILVYKVVDNFGNIQEWFGTFFRVLRPFIAGIFIAYILILPSRSIEKAYRTSKKQLIAKHARGLSVLTTYVIALLIVMIVINVIFPILRDSVVELFSNIQGYYETAVQAINELPEDSFLKSDIAMSIVERIQQINVPELLSISNEKILEYVQNLFNVFLAIFDVFVSIIVSIYILLQRESIIEFFRKLGKRILREETYEHLDKYFGQANELFFKFIGSQVIDAIVIGILTTVAMSIIGVKYAPLLGFMIGLFNIIPYIGAIIAVLIAIIITFITGGLGQTFAMAVIVILLQQIDANIINPKIIGNSLKISPLLVIFSVTIGGAYFGIMGMFLAVPVAAVIKLIMEDFVSQ